MAIYKLIANGSFGPDEPQAPAATRAIDGSF